MHAVTIAIRPLVAEALALAESWRRHHPADSTFTIVAVDEALEAPEGVTVVPAADLAGLEEDYPRLPFLFDWREQLEYLVPFALRHVVASTGGATLALHPATLVLGPVDDLAPQLEGRELLLSPTGKAHRGWLDALPPGTDLRSIGAWDLGLVGAGPHGRAALDWWCDWQRGTRDPVPEALDFAATLFDCARVDDPGIGAAHWNLALVDISDDAPVRIDGSPLRLLRLPGFDPRQPFLLSLDQWDLPTVLLSEHPALAQVLDAHAERLLAHGAIDTHGYEQPPVVLRDGTVIDDVARRAYADHLVRAETDSRYPFPPALRDEDDPGALRRWLLEPADKPGAKGHMTRYLHRVWDERPDIQQAFPTADGPGLQDFLRWVHAYGIREMRLSPELVPELGNAAPGLHLEAGRPKRLERGVRAIGYFGAQIGLGEAARSLVAGLEAAGVPYATVTYQPNIPSGQDHPWEDHGTDAVRFDTNIVCLNMNILEAFAAEVGPDVFRGRYTIGQWFWEVNEVPDELLPAFDHVDEVWVTCDWLVDILRRYTDKPVLRMPMVVEAPEPRPVTREQMGLPEGFMFLFMFDHHSVIERKNPFGVIDAFKRAFEPGEGPVLVIKSHKGDVRRMGMERLRRAARGRDDIVLVDGYVPEWKKDGFMTTCDCYVSLHRSEGYGLTMAEAMAQGKPVIATRYSGNLAFMNDDVSYLVDHGYVPIPPHANPYPQGVDWADPDVDQAARYMRAVYDDPAAARATGERARLHVEEVLSTRATGTFIRERLEQVWSERASAPKQLRRRLREFAASRPLLRRAGRSARAALHHLRHG